MGINTMSTLALILATLCTILVVMIAREILFKGPGKKVKTKKDPQMAENVKDMTVDQLSKFVGDEDGDSPIYVAVDGLIYDVSRAYKLYGPNGAYHLFAGKDASYYLAVNSLKPIPKEEQNMNTLSTVERDRMLEWKNLFN